MIAIIESYKTDNANLKKALKFFPNDKPKLYQIEGEIDKQKIFDLPNKVIILSGAALHKAFGLKTVTTLENKIFIPVKADDKSNQKLHLEALTLAYDYLYDRVLTKAPPKFEIVDTIERLKEVREFARKSKMMIFDSETLGVKPEWNFDYWRKSSVMTCLGLSFNVGYTFVIPIEHKDHVWNNLNEVLDILKEIFGFDNHKVAHNFKYDEKWLLRYGIKIWGRKGDTMLMHHLLDENTEHGLKVLCNLFFPYWKDYDSDINYDDPLPIIGQYLAYDCTVTYMLFYKLYSQLIQDKAIYRVYRNVQIGLSNALTKCEYDGALIDRDFLIGCKEKAEQYLTQKDEKLKSFPEVDRFILAKNNQMVKDKIRQIQDKITKRRNKSILKLNEKSDKLKLGIRELEKNLSELKSKKTENLQVLNTEKVSKEWAKLTKDIEKLNNKITKEKLKLSEIKPNDYTDKFIDNWSDEIRDLKTGGKVLYKEILFSSPAQLAALFYDGFKFDVPIIAGEKKRSTGKEALLTIKHPFIETLRARRSISKMINTYYKNLLNLDDNDRFHGSFMIHGTVSQRLGSFLHTMPKRSGLEDKEAVEVLKNITKFFKCPKGMTLVMFDFSQAELVEAAMQSEDENMISDYKNGIDLHLKTGAAIAGKTIEEVKALPKDQYGKIRTKGKPANFGRLYLQDDYGYIQFAKNTYGVDVTDKEAKQHKAILFKNYPRIPIWQREVQKRINENGFAQSLFGTKRRFPTLKKERIPKLISQMMRQGVNFEIQSSIGNYTNFCVSLLNERLPKGCQIWTTIHDSIGAYIPTDRLDECIEIIKDTCINPPLEWFDIPERPLKMKLDIEISNKSWGEELVPHNQ